MTRIAIFLPNWIGDVVMATPAVRAVREAFPAAELVAVCKPYVADVLVKGADYRKEDVVGADVVEGYGGRVHLAPVRDGFSTTRLIERMRAA